MNKQKAKEGWRLVVVMVSGEVSDQIHQLLVLPICDTDRFHIYWHAEYQLLDSGIDGIIIGFLLPSWKPHA